MSKDLLRFGEGAVLFTVFYICLSPPNLSEANRDGIFTELTTASASYFGLSICGQCKYWMHIFES